MVFVGNTSHNVPYMLKNSDLFDELPESYHDSAYLDRLHFYVPGWEVDTIRGEMFSDGYGFVVDYIAEVLKSMRDVDYSDRYQQHFTLGSDISTRDRDGIHKTFSGLSKIGSQKIVSINFVGTTILLEQGEQGNPAIYCLLG